MNGEPFVVYTFGTGEKAAIELSRVGVISKYLYRHDFTVTETSAVSIPFTDTQTLALAYKNGGLRLILKADYSYTNVFGSGTGLSTIQTSVCVTAQIRRNSVHNFSIRAMLEDSVLFIEVNAGMLSAVIRRIALA